MRDRGALARLVDDGRIENVYRLQLMNATEQPQRYRIAVQGLAGAELPAADAVELARRAGALGHAGGARAARLGARRGAGRAPDPLPDREPSTNPAVTVSEKSTFVVPR